MYVGKQVSMARRLRSTGRPRSATTRSSPCRRWSSRPRRGPGRGGAGVAKIFGVKIAQGRYVSTGMVVTKQTDALPEITDDYPFKDIYKTVVHVNTQVADGYNGKKAAGKH